METFLLIAFNAPACDGTRLKRTVDVAAEIGLDGVVWYLADTGPQAATKLAVTLGRATADVGLAVLALEWQFALPIRASAGLDDDVRRLAECTATSGSDQFVVVPGPYPETVSDKHAAEEFGETLTRAADVAAESGVRIAVGLRNTLGWNRARTRAKTCSSFLADVMRSVGRTTIRIRWDIQQPYLEGERIDQTWDNVRPWLSYLEIGDLKHGGAGWEPVPVGYGDIPVSFALAYVGGARYSGWISHDPGDDPGDLGETLRAYLRFVDNYLYSENGRLR